MLSRIVRVDTAFSPTWLLLAAAVFSPLFLFPHQMPVATAIALAALLTLLLLTRRPRLPATPLDVPLTLYLAFSALAFLAGPLPHQSLRRLTTLFLGAVVFYLLVSWLRDRPKRFALAARSLALMGALIAVGDLFVMEWPSRHIFDLSFLTSKLPRLSVSFTVHHNQMAGLLLLLLPLAAVLCKEASTRRWRLLWATALAAMLLTFVLTQSRNGWLALLVAVAGAVFWQRRRFTLLAALALLLLLLPFLVAQLPASSSLMLALDEIDATTKAGAATDRSWSGRAEMWSAAVRIMADYPLLGAGLYTFEPVSRANHVYETVRPTFPISHAHNLLMQTGAGLGWPGWLAAVVLWLSLLYTLWRASRRAPSHLQPLGQALGVAFLGYLSFNTWDVLALEQRAGLLVWLALALAAAYAASCGGSGGEYDAGAGRSLFGRRQRLLQAAPLALFLLLLPALPRNLGHLRLDRVRLAGAPAGALEPEQMGNARRQALAHYLQGSEQEAHLRWAQDPLAVPFLLRQGQLAYFNGQKAAAVGWYDQALALNPAAATAYYWRGLAHEALGSEEIALADYRQAADTEDGEKVYGIQLKAVAFDRQGRLLAQQHAWQAAADAFAIASALAPQVDDYQHRLQEVRQILSEQGVWEGR